MEDYYYSFETLKTYTLEQHRRDYNRYGLYIFESFEEYMQDKEEQEED